MEQESLYKAGRTEETVFLMESKRSTMEITKGIWQELVIDESDGLMDWVKQIIQ